MSQMNNCPRIQNNAVADWATLPQELLCLVARKLPHICDHINFRTVCASWRLAVGPKDLIHPQVPWLLLPFENTIAGISFVDLSNPCTRSCLYAFDLPDIQHYEITNGSSQGWLIMVRKYKYTYNDFKVYLLNPITRARITLPLFPDELNIIYIQKIVLCSHPDSARPEQLLVVLMIHESKLGFYRQEDKGWTLLNYSAKGIGQIIDILCVEDKLYAFDINKKLMMVDAGTFEVRMSIPGPVQLLHQHHLHSSHLVEAAGNLLVVSCHGEEANPLARIITVFKLQECLDRESNWVMIGTIDIRAPSQSMRTDICPHAQRFPGGYQIYLAHFAGDYNEYRKGIYIIDVSAGGVKQTKIHAPAPSGLNWPCINYYLNAPTWIVPHLF